MFLAKTYLVDWSVAYNNSKVIAKIVKAINIHYAAVTSNPEIVGKTWELSSEGIYFFYTGKDMILMTEATYGIFCISCEFCYLSI